MEVILTVQNFICRFQVVFSSSSMQRRRPVQHPCVYQNLEGPWDLLIRIASIRKRKSRRVAYAYEAINLQGVAIFQGGTSCAAVNTNAALQEALVETALKAKRLGFCRILFSCSNSRVVQACNCLCSNSWQDMVMVADLRSLKQQGVCCKALHVPRSILDSVYCIADLAATIPGNHSWITPELVY